MKVLEKRDIRLLAQKISLLINSKNKNTKEAGTKILISNLCLWRNSDNYVLLSCEAQDICDELLN